MTNKAEKPRNFRYGYSPVLLRTDLKNELKVFRIQRGWEHEQDIERCLVSAAVDLALNGPGLQEQLIEKLMQATHIDTQLRLGRQPNLVPETA